MRCTLLMLLLQVGCLSFTGEGGRRLQGQELMEDLNGRTIEVARRTNYVYVVGFYIRMYATRLYAINLFILCIKNKQETGRGAEPGLQ